MADPMGIAPDAEPTLIQMRFREALAARRKARRFKMDVVEIGTRRTQPDRPTHHEAWLPEGMKLHKIDIDDGEDVDEVLDLHQIGDFHPSRFDGAILVAVLEHIARPWVAIESLHRALRGDAPVYVATHFAFPWHGYPNDYWRFTPAGLGELFDVRDWHSFDADWQFPATITPPPEVTVWDASAPVYLNVEAWAKASR